MITPKCFSVEAEQHVAEAQLQPFYQGAPELSPIYGEPSGTRCALARRCRLQSHMGGSPLVMPAVRKPFSRTGSADASLLAGHFFRVRDKPKIAKRPHERARQRWRVGRPPGARRVAG